jgi:diguanylate cyclase (GGDEF)-like protein
MLKYFRVPSGFDVNDLRLYRKAQFINFVLLLSIVGFAYGIFANIFVTRFYFLAGAEIWSLAFIVLGYYRYRTRLDLVFSAWILSTLGGIFILFLIVYFKGGFDIYAMVLIYPLLLYPVHGKKVGTILLVVYSVLVLATMIFGMERWGLTEMESAARLISVSVALVFGGSIIFYLEYTKEEALDKLHDESITDSLTGLWNRKMFDQVLSMELSKSQRHQFPLSMILLDLDHFKSINDTYGHQVGDTVLKEFSERLVSHKREGDTVARWGGEEFVMLLPNTTVDAAEKVAFALVDLVRSAPFRDVESVTVSAGVGEMAADLGIEENFNRVDEALYEAKSTGRDRYVSVS